MVNKEELQRKEERVSLWEKYRKLPEGATWLGDKVSWTKNEEGKFLIYGNGKLTI